MTNHEIKVTPAGTMIEVAVGPDGQLTRTETQMFRREVVGALYSLAEVIVERETDPELAGCWHVHPVWAGVDRPDTGGWVVRGRKIAGRLADAITDLKAITPGAVLVDVNGATYVETTSHVLGRTMNADLRRLGY